MAFKTCESLDTNVILRIILKDTPEQGLKIQDMFMRQGVTYEVADLAVTEVVYVLQTFYRWTRSGIVDALTAILEAFPLKYNKVLFERVFRMYLEHPKLSFNDCCLAVIYVSGKIEARLDFIGNDYVIYNGDSCYNHDLCVCLDCGDIERITESIKFSPVTYLSLVI